MMRLISLALFLGMVSLMLALAQPEAEGCAAIGPRGEDYIRIAEESAVIVWDSTKKIEHFIRRAAFDTKSPDFGFLVPTPTVPVLAEVNDRIFREASRWILPTTVEKTKLNFAPIICMLGCHAMPMAAVMDKKDGVRILAEQKVGGYDAKVLEADDAEELAKWIKDHGYSADPELYAWLTPYVASKWKITAFKISQDPKTGNMAPTKPVRMSFATERPYFPYREPEVKKDKEMYHGSRLLRVFFISDVRVEGKLGNQKPWHAEVPWSDELTDVQRKELARETGVAESDLPAKAWMTTFDDRASPRPGHDEVYFDPAQDRTPIRPPPYIRYKEIWIPFDAVLFGLAFMFFIGFIIKRLVTAGKRAAPRLPMRTPPKENGPLPTPWSPP